MGVSGKCWLSISSDPHFSLILEPRILGTKTSPYKHKVKQYIANGECGKFLFNAHQSGYEYHYLDVFWSPFLYNQSSQITGVRISEVPQYNALNL